MAALCRLISMRQVVTIRLSCLESLKMRCNRRSEAYPWSNGQNKCSFGHYQLPWSRRRVCPIASWTPSKKAPMGTCFDGDWLKTDRLVQWPKLGTFVCRIWYIVGDNPLPLSYGHTQLNPPHPVRSAQLNSWWHSQYYGGGPHGNTLCCSFLFLLFYYFNVRILFFFRDWAKNWVSTSQFFLRFFRVF